MLKSWVKRVVGGIVLAALIVFLGGCGAPTLEGPAPPTRASISGTVISKSTGEGLQDVPIRIASSIVHTDQWGRFTVLNLRAGTYPLVVEAEGYQDYAQTVRLAAGENTVGDIGLLDLPPEPPVL